MATGAWADEVVDLGGVAVSKTGSEFGEEYKDKIIQNGTITLTESRFPAGTYTIGSGAILNRSADEFALNDTVTLNIVDGGVFNFTAAKAFMFPFRYGNGTLVLDNGIITNINHFSSDNRLSVNIGYVYNNRDDSKGKNVSMHAVIRNGSRMELGLGGLRISGAKSSEKKLNTCTTDFAVTNSTIVVTNASIEVGTNVNPSDWLSSPGSSYVNVVFGPGTELYCKQIYTRKSTTPSVTFDGATIHWVQGGNSFIGHVSEVGDIYTIDPLGLAVDIPSGKSLTCDSNASSLKGEGGITKIGEGSITWNNVSSGGSRGMTFTGPLVVSNGTWTSTLDYAATAFAVDGATSTLALSGELTAAAPDFSVTAGGTLDLVSKEPKDRTAGTLMLGENAVLKLNGGAMGVDSFSATSLDLAATAANPVKIEFDDAGNIASGTYNLITITGGGEFAAGDEAKFALDADAPEGSTLSVSGASLVLTVPATNPATWTGGANDGKFSSVNNWLGKAVPGEDADVVISVSSETTLDCDIALSVNSITFPSTSAKVTINGTGSITCAATIKNYAEARHAIGVSVEFYASEAYAPIDVMGEVDFQGGVTGTVPVNHTTFYGKYTLTAEKWTLSQAITLAKGANLIANSMTLERNNKALNSDVGSLLKVKNFKPGGGSVFGSFSGTMEVDYVDGESIGEWSIGSGLKGVMRIGDLYYYSGSYYKTFACNPDETAEILMGGGKLRVKRGKFLFSGCRFKSFGDWSFEIDDNNYDSNSSGVIEIGQNGIEVDTSDYDNPAADGHTVSVIDTSTKGDDIFIGSGSVKVTGNGIFKFQNTGLFTGGFVASDNVTVAVNKNAYPGKGDVTIKDTATLKLAQSSSGTVPVAGTLTIFGGTTLRIPEFTAGVLPLSVNALAFDGVTAENKVALNIEGGALAPGFNAIIQSATALPANAWDSFAVTLGATVPDGMEPLYVVQGNTLYIVVKGENDSIWTGAGAAANFSDSANWLGGKVPADGECVHIAAAGEATLVCDIANFKPASIVFPAGSATVTINGTEAITGVVAITNLSTTASHTINVPVYFTGDIQVKQAAMAETDDLSKAHVTFAGGAHAAEGFAIENGDFAAVYSRCMFGDYYLYPSTENPWTALYQGNGKRICLAKNSTLHITHTKHMKELYVGANAKVYAGNTILDGRLMYNMAAGGEMIVTNMTLSGTGDRYLSYNQGTSNAGVFKFDSVTNSMSKNWFYFADANAAAKHTIYIGAGGLSLEGASGSGAYCLGRDTSGNSVTLRPWYSDFTIGARSTDVYGIYVKRDVTFNTDDESGTGRKITIDAIMRSNNTPAITVCGSGTLQVNSVASNIAEPSVTVADTATLALKPGACLTKGSTTVNSGATLQVAQSGTVALGGDLTLKAGAQLGFNYTNRNAPKLDLTDKTVTFDEGESPNVLVKISASTDKRPSSGKNVLTSGRKFVGVTVTLAPVAAPDWVKGIDVVDGEIVLDVKPMGTRIIVR